MSEIGQVAGQAPRMYTLAPIHIKPLLELYCMVLSEDMPHLEGLNPEFFRRLEDEELVRRKDPPPGDSERCIYELTERGRVIRHDSDGLSLLIDRDKLTKKGRAEAIAALEAAAARLKE